MSSNETESMNDWVLNPLALFKNFYLFIFIFLPWLLVDWWNVISCYWSCLGSISKWFWLSFGPFRISVFCMLGLGRSVSVVISCLIMKIFTLCYICITHHDWHYATASQGNLFKQISEYECRIWFVLVSFWSLVLTSHFLAGFGCMQINSQCGEHWSGDNSALFKMYLDSYADILWNGLARNFSSFLCKLLIWLHRKSWPR